MLRVGRGAVVGTQPSPQAEPQHKWAHVEICVTAGVIATPPRPNQGLVRDKMLCTLNSSTVHNTLQILHRPVAVC